MIITTHHPTHIYQDAGPNKSPFTSVTCHGLTREQFDAFAPIAEEEVWASGCVDGRRWWSHRAREGGIEIEFFTTEPPIKGKGANAK